MRFCDICHKNGADHVETVVENGASKQYAYCDGCYLRAIALGKDPCKLAAESLARVGFECPVCGYTAERFSKTYLFGCSECYSHMRGVAEAELLRLKRGAGGYDETLDRLTNEERGRVKDYVVSSRVRLARNVRGLPFPQVEEEKVNSGELDREATRLYLSFFREAEAAANGVFDYEIYDMGDLDAIKRAMLLERHLISLKLAKSELGSVIVEKGENCEMSVMLNEEDHVRAQCVKRGLNLAGAYARLKRYDGALKNRLPIAYDPNWGYLTACPTNVGTGMRASVMMFLPALKSLGKLDMAFDALKRRFGITVRGYFGEGSEAAYDMYQVSNADTLSHCEEDTVRLVESAAMQLAAFESSATRELLRVGETKLLDRLQRSYGTLLHAHTLEADEMFELLTDVRLGVRIGIFDVRIDQLDGILDDLSTAFEILSENLGAERRGVKRAQIVKERLETKY